MWVYEGKEFTEDMIPEGAVGFVYEMLAITNDHSYRYIGKKNFYADVKTKLNKKDLPSDKRLKTYKRVRKSTYQNYYSSNEVLKLAHKAGIAIRREIIMICYSKQMLSYYECKYQFSLGVLENDEFLNGNILGKFYKIK